MVSAPAVRLDAAAEARALRFVLITLFLNSASFGIIIPVMPRLVMELANV
ncbi:MAG: hypothetical protein H2056_09035, partial [Sphingopyxis sp.]|nr:hypothetical protein [Sphingopyxis sp.]